jgi:hypothetical protein
MLEKHESESLAYWHRALTRLVEIRGWDRANCLTHPYADDRDRYEAWLVDSLLWTIEEIQAARPVTAVRGLLQAAGYSGHLSGFPGPSASDCFLTLRNIFERILGRDRQ